MTDVVKKPVSSASTYNGSIVINGFRRGRAIIDHVGVPVNTLPISGVAGKTNNGYLDTRFDDRTYYN